MKFPNHTGIVISSKQNKHAFYEVASTFFVYVCVCVIEQVENRISSISAYHYSHDSTILSQNYPLLKITGDLAVEQFIMQITCASKSQYLTCEVLTFTGTCESIGFYSSLCLGLTIFSKIFFLIFKKIFFLN